MEAQAEEVRSIKKDAKAPEKNKEKRGPTMTSAAL